MDVKDARDRALKLLVELDGMRGKYASRWREIRVGAWMRMDVIAEILEQEEVSAVSVWLERKSRSVALEGVRYQLGDYLRAVITDPGTTIEQAKAMCDDILRERGFVLEEDGDRKVGADEEVKR